MGLRPGMVVAPSLAELDATGAVQEPPAQVETELESGD
jgi:hypothetical protein